MSLYMYMVAENNRLGTASGLVFVSVSFNLANLFTLEVDFVRLISSQLC